MREETEPLLVTDRGTKPVFPPETDLQENLLLQCCGQHFSVNYSFARGRQTRSSYQKILRSQTLLTPPTLNKELFISNCSSYLSHGVARDEN